MAKQLYIFAGVDGAGKSTFYVNQLYKDGFFGARINPGEIVKEFGNWKSQKDQNRAAKIALSLRKSYLSRGIDFNIETTLSGHGIIKFIKLAKEKGYHITLFYVGLDSVALSKQRVAIRVAKNGHSIDEAVLERRYSQSFKNLAIALPLCDEIFFYDNCAHIANEQDQQLSNLKLVAVKKNGKIEKILDENVPWFEGVVKDI
ncbi:zeta toxin family protein [Campylobacter sp. 19-13652]|uniref:zeta toxin family protein n=1 Tax=Campylobacter sp. 19-13652 TaxID=2840180 RepID=UPI001C841ADF|nr:zeta toxin family protein [Campylobacter sp. 19-13652]